MKESDTEYAKVTIIISSPDSTVPTKIQQSQINEKIDIDELKRLEIKKHSDLTEDHRAKQNRQDNIGLCIVFVFMVICAVVVVTTKIILLDLDTYPMNYWLGRASYFEKEGINTQDEVSSAYRRTAILVDDDQAVDNIPKRNIAHVYVTFDKKNL